MIEIIATKYEDTIKYRKINGLWYRVGGYQYKPSAMPVFDKSDVIRRCRRKIFHGDIVCSCLDLEKWSVVKKAWGWWKSKEKAWIKTDSGKYMMETGWPNANRIFQTIEKFGVLPVGTCMSKAQIFAQILRVGGIHPDSIGIATCKSKPGYSQHMYPAIKFSDKWIFLDPQFVNDRFQLPDDIGSHILPESIKFDYLHPYRIGRFQDAGPFDGVPMISGAQKTKKKGYIFK